MKQEVLRSYGGTIKLIEYTYPNGVVAYRVVKGRSVLCMTRNATTAQGIYEKAIKEVVA